MNSRLCVLLDSLPPRIEFRSLMEHYIRDLEGMLDGDLVNALDDNLGQQIQDNYKEKVR